MKLKIKYDTDIQLTSQYLTPKCKEFETFIIHYYV